MSNGSPFLEFARRSGARMETWFGVERVNDFGDPAAEMSAAESKAAWFDLSLRNVVEVSGRDAADFLERVSSNHVKDLKAGETALTAILTAQAKIVSVALALRKTDTYWLSAGTAEIQPLISFLEKYIIVDDVTLAGKQDELSVLGLQGPDSGCELERLGFGKQNLPEEGKHVEGQLGGVPVTLLKKSWGPVPGYAVYLPLKEARTLCSAISKKDALAIWAGMEVLNALRIKNGIPWHGPDMNDTYLLPETGLEGAVSYTKGCYTGQEIVARLKSRGQVRKKLTRLCMAKAAALPKPDTEILSGGAKAGYVTSAARDPLRGAVYVLGYIETGALEKNNGFTILDLSAAVVS